MRAEEDLLAAQGDRARRSASGRPSCRRSWARRRRRTARSASTARPTCRHRRASPRETAAQTTAAARQLRCSTPTDTRTPMAPKSGMRCGSIMGEPIMNRAKRQFIARCAAILGGSTMAHMFGRTPAGATQDPLTNWAGNYRYSTDRLHRATSLEDVRAFVKQHDRLRVLGTRHCFNGIADSTHNLLSVRDMARVVAVDPDRPDGDRRSRHELRPVVSRPRSAGLRAAQPRLAAPHLHRRRMRDRHARVWRHATATWRRRFPHSRSSRPTARC